MPAPFPMSSSKFIFLNHPISFSMISCNPKFSAICDYDKSCDKLPY